MDRLYTAEASAYGRRTGAVITSDDRLDLQLSRPKDMGGDDGQGTNPEQLFAAGYAACFHSALRLVGRKERADLTDSAVAAKVHLGQLDDGGFGIAAELEIALPALDLATAEKLVAKAHQVCPYSNATRGNISVDIKVLEYAA